MGLYHEPPKTDLGLEKKRINFTNSHRAAMDVHAKSIELIDIQMSGPNTVMGMQITRGDAEALLEAIELALYGEQLKMSQAQEDLFSILNVDGDRNEVTLRDAHLNTAAYLVREAEHLDARAEAMTNCHPNEIWR